MNSEIEKAIIAWFKTFDLPEGAKIDDFSDLFDGLILTEIMHKMYLIIKM